jgi:hypothetical protein
MEMIEQVPDGHSTSSCCIVRRRRLVVGRVAKSSSLLLTWNRNFILTLVWLFMMRCDAFLASTKSHNHVLTRVGQRKIQYYYSNFQTPSPYDNRVKSVIAGSISSSLMLSNTVMMNGSSRSSKSRNDGVTDYNVQAIYDYYDRRPWEVVWRLNCLGLPLFMWYVGLSLDELFGVSKDPNVQRKRGAELRDLLVRSVSIQEAKEKVKKKPNRTVNLVSQ